MSPIGLAILAYFAAHDELTLAKPRVISVASARTKWRDYDSNGKGGVAMKHRHKPGCRCACCLSEFERREIAAQQLYDLLQMSWIGMQTATAYAQFAREGIEEAFSDHARANLGRLRQQNDQMLDSLLADILD